MHGANIDDGIAAMRAMVAIARSAETGDRVLSDVTVGRSDATGYFRQDLSGRPWKRIWMPCGAHGLQCVQYNLVCAGLPTLPESIDSELCDRIRRGLPPAACRWPPFSGTFNIIDPDPGGRQAGLRRLRIWPTPASPGTSVITLCTGTRDPDNMWRRHPDNAPSLARPGRRVEAGHARSPRRTTVTLAFEPEPNNVVDRPGRAGDCSTSCAPRVSR